MRQNLRFFNRRDENQRRNFQRDDSQKSRLPLHSETRMCKL